MRYRMPAEWELHEGTWLAWPHNTSHWPGKFEPIPGVFAQIVHALREGEEKVFICVNNAASEAVAQKIIGEKDPGIIFFHIPTNTSWTRDHGPIFVRDSERRLVITDWIFNTWGGKYPPWDKDGVVPQHVARHLHLPVIEPGMVLEGGSIEVNGEGSLLTTEQCLLHKNRNPNLTKSQIEERLRKYFGVTNILWLKEGIVGDDTDGHIDDVARFVDAKKIVAAVEKNPQDENYNILQKNLADLKSMRDQNGAPFEISTIPMPVPIFYDGQRLPASYVNFYIANKAVLVPTFNCAVDKEALAILADLFPNRKIIGIDCVDLVWGLGAIHCSTQQQPAG